MPTRGSVSPSVASTQASPAIRDTSRARGPAARGGADGRLRRGRPRLHGKTEANLQGSMTLFRNQGQRIRACSPLAWWGGHGQRDRTVAAAAGHRVILGDANPPQCESHDGIAKSLARAVERDPSKHRARHLEPISDTGDMSLTSIATPMRPHHRSRTRGSRREAHAVLRARAGRTNDSIWRQPSLPCRHRRR